MSEIVQLPYECFGESNTSGEVKKVPDDLAEWEHAQQLSRRYPNGISAQHGDSVQEILSGGEHPELLLLLNGTISMEQYLQRCSHETDPTD